MITTINEFKKINEGGGAGISFKTNSTVNMSIELIDNKFTIKEYNPSYDTLDAHGYDDGMSDVNLSKIIKWSIPGDLKLNDLLSLVVEDSSDLGLEDNLTVKQILEQSEQPIVKVEIGINAKFNYDNMHFGGWIRGKFDEGDLVLSQEKNREGMDCEYYEYSFHFYYDDDSVDTCVSTFENEEFLLNIAPHGTATEEFVYWFDDVFNYDCQKDAKIIAYHGVQDDKYDDELEEYMSYHKWRDFERWSENDILDSLEVYKQSLINDEEELPEDLYDYIQKERDVETWANDMHWEDVQANWGN